MDTNTEMSTADNLKTIQQSNKDMIEYFNHDFISKLEEVQSLKTEEFELKIKIDELTRTLEIYSFRNTSSHNVFSPFAVDPTTNEEKYTQIDQNLKDLKEVKSSLSEKITGLEKEIDELKARISSLSSSNKVIDSLLAQNVLEQNDKKALKEAEEKLREQKEALEKADKEHSSELLKQDINHGLRILMLERYFRQITAIKINDKIRASFEGNKNKLDILSWMIKSDVNRAKVTLDELIEANNELSKSIDSVLFELTNEPDTSKPVWTLLSDKFKELSDTHKECMIEYKVDCPDYDIKIPQIVTINLIYIIDELMSNVFKHSNANKVTANIYISSRLIDVYINDNGIGIDTNYTHTAPWYSGLHRIQEIIYLMKGTFSIDGDIISGTNVRFSFPINQD